MTRTRKPRRKATTDLGRSIMQKERQRLAREQADLAEKLAEDAARARRAASKRTKETTATTAEMAMQRSVVRRVAGVLSSENVTVPMRAEAIDGSRTINAWTDFDQIYVGYHMLDDIKLTAAVMRGLFYHEGGHCRFTLPFVDLEEMAARESGYATPHVHNPDYMVVDANAFRLAVAGADISKAELFRAWNALEDQRMETAVVSDSPRKAGYFTPMMLSELAYTPESALANWPLMVWRRYLPSKIRDGARKLFVEKHGADLARRITKIVSRYVLGQDAVTMYMACVDMADVFKTIQTAYDLTDAGHRRQRSKGESKDNVTWEIPVDPSMKEEGDEAGDDDSQSVPAPGQASDMPMPPMDDSEQETGDSDDDAEGADGDGQQQGDGANKAKKEKEKAEGGASGTHESDDAGLPEPSKDSKGSDEAEGDEADEAEDEGLTQDDLDEAKAEAEAERLKDSALNQDVQSFHNAKADTASGLEPYVGGINTDPLAIAEANNLAEDIKRSFEQATVDLSPTWHEQQRRGVINVLRYETRQAGDVEFFRAFVDNGAPGCDIAVSVLLDYSGSMGGAVEELAKVAYACKRAAQDLNIPCTVTLWDTSARVLWDASETAEHVPTIRAAGGTNPAKALDDLDAQTYGKSKHVVLVMTDDAWNNGAPTLAAYKAEGRIIIGLGYTEGYDHPGIQESLERKGADFAYSIKDLAEIPKHLEQALVEAA